MTQAADDFALVKRAVMFDADTDERCGFKDDAEATRKAFKRLFTPRPLRELFDQGWRHCMAWNPATPDIQARYFDLRHNEAKDFNGTWRHYLAIPIITPEDMGEG